MLGHIPLGQFIPGHSPAHRLSPVSKIVIVIVSAVGIMLLPGFYGLLIAGGYLLLMMLFTGGTAVYAFKGLKPLWILIAFTFIFQALAVPGEPVFTLGAFDVTRQGLEKAGLMTGRLLFLVLLASLLTLTTSPIGLTRGLEKLLSPLKKFGLPVHELAMMMTIALRFIPTLINEAEVIIKAQRSRGSDLTRGNPVDRIKALIPFIVPLLAGSLRRAEELAVAMEARCYRGGNNRTAMKQMKMGRIDFAALTLALLFLLISISARLAGW
ncbi:energy-coupling factor transport system permease protein [Desulfohalotomaculum tongense]|uniref:energy-coupling factor transporter transmembrane component T family protein n=1 Tax=Desulforadius tongensis TaxID=1216062 RepID=UPI00195E34A1|nr:energy-coupling factor transporter transmembrane component T [Desulforadius tongensis]MBM7853858.1 energy-coupling factor transport system permease protein [Desulforadius tongensis]